VAEDDRMTLPTSFVGAHMLDGPITAVDVWQILHSNAKEWEEVPRNSKFFEIRDMLDQADRQALEKLASFEVTLWQHLCYGAGWTILGAIALSWCKDAQLEHVATGWAHVSAQVDTAEMTLHAVQKINPALVPPSNRLGDITAELNGDPFQIAITLAALKCDVLIDLDAQTILEAPPVLIPTLSMAIAEHERNAGFHDILNQWRDAKTEQKDDAAL